MTTSLVQYLVASGIPLLVDRVKEPFTFLRDDAADMVAPNLAVDGSVAYMVRPDAFRRIVALVPDYKIVVCMRDPAARTVSAYSWYRAAIADPRKLCGLVRGDYVQILCEVSGIGEQEARVAVELLERQSFGERLLWELRYTKTKGHFPPLSIITHSRYPLHLNAMFEVVDRDRVLLLQAGPEMGPRVLQWLGLPSSNAVFPHTNESTPDPRALALCRSLLGDVFDMDQLSATHAPPL